jgi:cytochrome c
MNKIFQATVASTLMLWSCLAATKPAPKVLMDENLQINMLSAGLLEAMEMDIDHEGRVFVAERHGKVKLYVPENKGVCHEILDLKSDTRGESGLIGLALDPDFKYNGWVYLYHTVAIADDEMYHEHRLGRFKFDGQKIDPVSEKILLRVKASHQRRIHEAGSIAFGPDGLLYLSVGDNQIRSEYLFSCKTSSNSNDYRGKILRIRPLADGTYEIPEGNLFKPGTPKTKPEIFVMGCRNPFRISVDSKTGWLLWGENGPPNNWSGTTNIDKSKLPLGYEEFNLAKNAGYYGYPMIIANQQSFINYDFENNKVGNPFDPNLPTNNHPGNTGLQKLPPSQKSLIWYAGESAEFPELEKGGESAISGPVYRHHEKLDPKLKLPEKYLNSWLIADWARGWVKAVHLDDHGEITGIDPILPKLKFGKPINLKLDLKGRLYVLYYTKDNTGSLVRVENQNIQPDAQPIAVFFETDPMPKRIKKNDHGYQLMKKSDCFACHQWNHSTIAPSYIQIAKKYKKQPENDVNLIEKVKLGGVGVWGHIPMPPHPQHSENELKKMLATIMKISRK